MPNVIAALSNTGGALCSTPQFGCAVMLPKHETHWNLHAAVNTLKSAGVPQTNETISAGSGP